MTSRGRPLYHHSHLARTIAPQSIAVVGASPRAGSFGHQTVANLEAFPGRVYAVNEKYTEVAGRKCYPSLADLPETPNCVIVAVGRDAVEPVVRDCAARGVGGVVVFAAGYAETGEPERKAHQQSLADLARETGLRIVGPNCVGLLNRSAHLVMSFSNLGDVRQPLPRGVGIASQSGSMANAVLQAVHQGLPISHMLAGGNSCDVDVADFVAYLAEDDACGVIVCLFEGLSDPQRLVEAGELAKARGKPLIVCKIATSEAGRSAALSHTGVLAGSNALYDAAFRRMNAIVVEDLEALAHTAAFFLKAPTRSNVAVLASSGGSCTVAVDKSEKYGVHLKPLSAALRQELVTILPEFANPGNPCDMTAQWTVESSRACYEAMLRGDEYDALVFPYTFASERNTLRIAGLAEAAQRHGKLACLVWTTAWSDGPGWKEAAAAQNVVVFRSMEDCFRTLGAWQAWQRALQERQGASASPRVAIDAAARKRAGDLLKQSVGAGTTISERASKAILREYGIPMVGDWLVGSEEEAVSAAREFGLPVVLKLDVEGLAHKTEAGGVLLDLRSEAEVRQGYARLVAAAAAAGGHFNGVLVQPMVGKGVEVIAGVRIDAQFGPTVMVGLGGILVEVLQDSAVDFAPLTLAQAEAMIGRLRAQKMLAGARGAPPVDRRALAEVLCRLSEFAADHAGSLQEVDINPLICRGSDIVAVDALIAGHPGNA